jgi:uncharacterized lipoprotein YmbA
MKFRLLAPAVVATALVAGCASPPIDLLGRPAAPSAATQTIVITPATKWVNVTTGDTVKFVVADKAFAWNFTVAPTVSYFPLNKVAPPGILDREVAVYVTQDLRYSNGGQTPAP